MSKRVRVAVYARVSSDEQREAATIENQLDYAKEACRRRDFEVVGTYKDDGVSGTLPLERRPEGARLLEDARLSRFDAVVFYRLDRLARDQLIILKTHETLESYGVSVVSLTEPFDTTTPSGRVFFQMLGSFAEFERGSIAERMRLGKDRKRRQGKRVGSTPLLGYFTNQDGVMEVKEDEAEVVRTIYRLYTQEGMGSSEITDYLNGRGIPTSSSYKGTHSHSSHRWHRTRVSEILRNPAYKGEFMYGFFYGKEGERVAIPAIVDPEVWAQAQIIRCKKTRHRRHPRKEYLLYGYVSCARCGSDFTGVWSWKPEYTYYRCSGVDNRGGRLAEKCRARMVRADHLDELVWAEIRSFVTNPGPVMVELQSRLQYETKRLAVADQEIQVIDHGLESKQAERQRVLHLFRIGKVTEAEADKELTDLQREVDALQDRRSELANRDASLQQMRNQTLDAQVLLALLRDKVEGADFATRRRLVEALVESVTVESIVDDKGVRRPKVTATYRFSRPDPSNGGSRNDMAHWMATAS